MTLGEKLNKILQETNKNTFIAKSKANEYYFLLSSRLEKQALNNCNTLFLDSKAFEFLYDESIGDLVFSELIHRFEGEDITIEKTDDGFVASF